MRSFNIQRAIISVWDKSGILPLSRFLVENGVEIFSTGGTYTKLKESGIEVQKIEDLTHFHEILGGRVKTLHPTIFAGILADLNEETHRRDLSAVSIQPFQLVIVNLYPFSETYHSDEKDPEKIVEMIDIGGPSMLRASSKNFKNVVVLSDPAQYNDFQDRWEKDEIDLEYRRGLAAAVFDKTTQYDANIANFFHGVGLHSLPDRLTLSYKKLHTLRYGENPDQPAVIYAPADRQNWEAFHQIQGKEISYNNYIDCLSVYRIIRDFHSSLPVCVIVKHTNPCGFGKGATPLKAYQRAVVSDPVSYFGGIVGVNRPVDEDLAKELSKTFLECIIAPGFEEKALLHLAKKKNLRLLIPAEADLTNEWEFKSFGKGLITQRIQSIDDNENNWRIVTKSHPQKNQMETLKLGWRLVRHVKSNAIVLCDSDGTVGIGAGQMSRVDSLKIAIRKAEEAGLPVRGTLMASDAFFPFRDSIDIAAQYGILGIIQPGGSIKDPEVISACDEHGIFMIFTGQRVFKH